MLLEMADQSEFLNYKSSLEENKCIVSQQNGIDQQQPLGQKRRRVMSEEKKKIMMIKGSVNMRNVKRKREKMVKGERNLRKMQT
jgi:hypothetical protein